MAKGRAIYVRIIGDASSLEREFKSAAGATDKASGKILGLGKAAAFSAGAAGVGALAVALKKSYDAAKESELAQARLSSALKSADVSMSKYGGTIDNAIAKTSRLAAIDDEELSDSFSRLVRTSGDVQKSLDGMSLAANIARARNISLDSATKAVERAFAGSDTALRRFGVTVPKVTTNLAKARDEVDALKAAHDGKLSPALEKQADRMLAAARAADKQASASAALAKAQEQFAGASEAYGRTAAGAQERFNVALENVQERVGKVILPVVAKVLEKFSELLEWIDANWPRFQQAFDTAGAAVSGFYQKVRPIIDNFVRVIRGFVDLVAGLFTGDWSRVWQGMRQVVSGAFDNLKKLIQLQWEVFRTAMAALADRMLDGLRAGLSAIGGLIRDKLGDALSAIRNLFGAAFSAAAGFGAKVVEGIRSGMTGTLAAVTDKLADAVGAIGRIAGAAYRAAVAFGGKILDGIVDGLRGLGDALLNLVRGPVNKVIGAINSIKIPGFSIQTPDVPLPFGKKISVPDVNFAGVDPIPDIPLLAKGGVVRSPTLAMIGEAGPEAVVPLDRMGATGSTYVTVNVNGSVISERDLVDAVHRGLLQKQKRNVALGLT